MIWLLFEKPERRPVLDIRPIHAALLQILAQRLDGTQKLALFHRERTHRKIHRRALRQQQQRFEQRERILATGQSNRDAIAVPDHLEPRHGLAHFPPTIRQRPVSDSRLKFSPKYTRRTSRSEPSASGVPERNILPLLIMYARS